MVNYEFNTIEEQLLFSTLRIESLDENNQIVSIGTGFIMNREVEKDKYVIYLVSNKHVLLATDTINLVFTQKPENGSLPLIGQKELFRINNVKRNVHIHDNPKVYIAVFPITGLFTSNYNLYYKGIDYNMLADFNEEFLSVAQNVEFIGYPDNRYDETNNLPLIRNGMIASYPKVDYNGEPVFIIDAQVFPGSSGSPVMINLSFEHWKTGNIVVGGKLNVKLLGVLAATMIRNNRLAPVHSTQINMGTQEVIGLGIVYKATAIKEIINAIPY